MITVIHTDRGGGKVPIEVLDLEEYEAAGGRYPDHTGLYRDLRGLRRRIGAVARLPRPMYEPDREALTSLYFAEAVPVEDGYWLLLTPEA